MRLSLWQRRRREEDLEEEIQTHLQMAVHDRIERGESTEEAQYSARREFGNVGLVKEVTRNAWGWASLGRLAQDLRFGLRMLRKNPGFTAVAVLTLALGIGVNTAIFSVVNGILLLPLPYEDSKKLVRIFEIHQKEGSDEASPANFVDWQRQSQSFEGIAAVDGIRVNLTGRDYPEQLLAMCVTSDMFGILHAKPALGRVFREDEYDSPFLSRRTGSYQQYHAIILSNGLWRRRFGSDHGLIGQAITIEGRQVTVVGIMPAKFRFDEVPGWGTAECWIPGKYDQNEQPRMRQLMVIARLKAGITISQAQSEMDLIAGQLKEKRPKDNAGWGVRILPLRDTIVGNIGNELLVLFGAVGFVLLIACANVANLLLARSTVRQRELAVRASLGAGRARLLRQLLTETLLLSALAGIIGFLFAVWGVGSLVALAPADLPRLDEIAVDSRVFLFMLVTSVLAGIASGVAPALEASKADLIGGLKDGFRKPAGGRRRWMNDSLVISQIALALVLLIGAGLMIRTLARLQSVKLGFNPDRLLTAGIGVSPRRFMGRPTAQLVNIYSQLLERVKAIPGIEWVGMGMTPLLGGAWGTFHTEGQPNGLDCGMDAPTADYFRALGAHLAEGRFFNDYDTRDAAQVAIINRTLAQKWWPGESATGRKLGIEPKSYSITVVGVIEDVKMTNLERPPRPSVYFPMAQSRILTPGSMVVRTKGDPLNYVDALRTALKEVDSDTPLVRIATMEQLLGRSLAHRRFNMVLITLISALAFVIAALGIYGLIAYAAATRIHEIGIRLALGAQRGDILRLIFRRGVCLVAFGELLGFVGALSLNGVMSTMVFGVKTTDVATYAGVIVASATIALLASYVPSRRATKVDPIIAIKCE